MPGLEDKYMRIVKLDRQSKEDLLTRLLKRNTTQYPEYEEKVASIVADVRKRGDEAVFEYTRRFDKVALDPASVKVTESEVEEAYSQVDPELIRIIRRAIENIRSFHEKQLDKSWFETGSNGIILGQRITPLERVGVYVPGGKAAYPSSVLMNVIPAKVAGTDEIIMCTPCAPAVSDDQKDGQIPADSGKVYPTTLVAAKEAGVDSIFKIGGAQAIAAMAYGTGSVPKVDKIVGPGNIYVALAKRAVYGNVSIDSIAGPSEILVLADETANPRYVAADMLSQAEHDELASAILITSSEELARRVSDEIEIFCEKLERRDIIRKSLDNFGFILIADNMKEAVAAANEIASEHLEILTANPFETMTGIRNE